MAKKNALKPKLRRTVIAELLLDLDQVQAADDADRHRIAQLRHERQHVRRHHLRWRRPRAAVHKAAVPVVNIKAGWLRIDPPVEIEEERPDEADGKEETREENGQKDE